MTYDTKCHFEKTNVIVLDKNIQIKINKNNNDRDAHVQAHSDHKLENNENKQTKNKKTMTYDTSVILK
jgi:hypothetical protein